MNLARLGHQNATAEQEKRGFARAIGANQAHAIAHRNLHRQILKDGAIVTVTKGKVAHGKGRGQGWDCSKNSQGNLIADTNRNVECQPKASHRPELVQTVTNLDLMTRNDLSRPNLSRPKPVPTSTSPDLQRLGF